jgi:hypothetical protein
MLANRLAPRLDDLIKRNQSAFIKGRSILDNYKYVRGAAKLLWKRKIPKVLLKLDISKAFDTVAWPFLLELMRAWDFGQRWCDWIALLISTASTRILLNGQLGEMIWHRRGLRQGDTPVIDAVHPSDGCSKQITGDGLRARSVAANWTPDGEVLVQHVCRRCYYLCCPDDQ